MDQTTWFEEIFESLPVLSPADGDEADEKIEEIFPLSYKETAAFSLTGSEYEDWETRLSRAQAARSVNRSLCVSPDPID